jgi:PAS domain S-box-containing protein
VDTAGLAGEGIMIVERAEGNKAVIAFVNDTLSGMLGYQREEMLGMPARDLFLPGDRIWLQDKNRRKRKGEALPSHYGVMALRKDGSMLPIEISMSAMRYEDKSATVVYVRDVTERKQAEESLRESEAQFRAIFDGAAIGVSLLDSDGRPFKMNPALQQMLGYTLEELRNMAFTDYMHPDDAMVDVELFKEMAAGKRDHYQVEKRYIRKGGQMVWGRATLSPVHDSSGRFRFAIGMIEDITESKAAGENLRKSEEHFRSLIENALEGISIISREGIITYGRPSVEPMFGHKLEEIIGWDFSRIVHPDDMPNIINVFKKLLKNPGTTIRTQVRVRHKDGSWRTVEAVGKNLLDDPVVAGVVVNYRDVTEREQAHEALLRHTKRVEALHAIAQLASQTLELEELLNTALEKLVEVMDADAGCVYLLDTAEKELVLKTHRGISDDMISRVATIKLNENNVQKIKEWKGGSIPLREIFEEIGLTITKEAREKEQIQSFAVAPFAVRGQLSGLIAVGNRADRKFSPGDIDLLRAVGNQIGMSTQNAMLYEEVRALIRETIDAQETERERICLEVHDGVAQTLVAAFQYLQALEATLPDDTKGSPLLAKATVQVKQAIQESREIINSLQPATLSGLGLVSTLRHELKRLAQETGLKIDFKADAIRLSKDIETGLYRIIHEAIANARKHADTKQLRVKINSEDGGVRVEVRDWGKGFDQAYLDRARRRGTGLFSIRKRAELLKGTCEIQSKPGEGTTVHVEIPFSAAEISSG